MKFPLALGVFAVAISAQTPPPAMYPALPSETPANFAPVTSSFDYVKREVMIPMRDGVKLHTVILVPKGAKGAPILLTRTPYDAKRSYQSFRQLSPWPDPERIR